MVCPFCQIVRGEEKAYKVYEDESFMVFLDQRPLTKGNALVIPKKHYLWVDEVPNFGEYFEVARKVGLAAKKALGAEWICYLTLGQEIPHAHIRVIPRYNNDKQPIVPDLSVIESLSEIQMIEIANKLKQKMGGV